MSSTTESLYQLLPAIYRIRDAEQGEPLKAFLSVIAEQVAILEEDLEQLYDDQFIETCAEWVVPYIGDLIGYRTLYGITPRTASPRAEVANTIAYRRRKGTASMLEQLARDVTGWNARVVEFFQVLATTQFMNHLRPNNWYAPDLRQWEPLERLNTPFDSIAHTVDVRRIASGQGRYNIPNIGFFLWRLAAYPLTTSPAFKFDPLAPNDRRWLFSPLGHNMPLFTRPQTEDEITHLAEPIHVPMPISRRVLHEYLDAYYGQGKSLLLFREGQEVGVAEIEVCDLSDGQGGNWAHQPEDKIAIDPVLGRIAFPTNLPAPTDVEVTFHYGFSMDMGGGEYQRVDAFDQFDAETTLIRVPQDEATIQAALGVLGTGSGVIEITNNGLYQESLTIIAVSSQHIELRAASGKRPTLLLTDPLSIDVGKGAVVSLNGLLIGGNGVLVPPQPNQDDNLLRLLQIRHCTLVPGLTLDNAGIPQHPDTSSLIVEATKLSLSIHHSILGGLRVVEGADVQIRNSIVDATAEDKIAYATADASVTTGGGRLQIENSTIIGKLHTKMMELVSNSVLLARPAAGDTTVPIRSDRKQAGCVRFSYLPLDSQVPRRYHCQPQNAAEAMRVRPQFTSLRYGDPGYCQLSRSCAVEIRQGADDEAEMGVFHDLFQPQRETNLRVRLEEYLRFRLEAGIFYAT